VWFDVEEAVEGGAAGRSRNLSAKKKPTFTYHDVYDHQKKLRVLATFERGFGELPTTWG